MKASTVRKLLDEAAKDPSVKTIGQLKTKAREIQKEWFGTTHESTIIPLKVSTPEDISKAGNHMAEFGNYPTGMSGCEVVGLNGGCGAKCPVLQSGDCDVFDYEKEEFT